MISIIIPTYRPEDYLKECLNSLDLQTLDKSQYEVIIILNGEKHPFYTHIKETLEQYSFYSRLLYTSVSGVSNARNIGLNNVRGDFVCFIDDDDFVSPNYLENLYKLAQIDSSHVVVSNVHTIDANGLIGFDYISKAYAKNKVLQSRSIIKKRSFLSSCCCKLIPRQIIGTRRFVLDFSIGEDSLFMALISDRIEDIVLAPDDTVYYRRLRINSASRKKRDTQTIWRNKLRLIMTYVKIYLDGYNRYNPLLFLSRIIAVIIH